MSNSVEGILSRKLPSIEPSLSTLSYACVSWAAADGEIGVLELDKAEALELYRDCILPDMRDGDIGLVWYGEGMAGAVYDCRVSLELERRGGRDGTEYSYFYTYATVYSERTNAWLAERGVPLLTPAELGRSEPLA